MSTPELGRLERVGLRDLWQSEARDFAPWLARAENLALLAETLGLSLNPDSPARTVGPHVLCEEAGSGRRILVAGQLETSDDAHLGAALARAAEENAQVVACVAEVLAPPQRAALEWLNRVTVEPLAWYGAELSLWRIDDSPTAPRFEAVCGPQQASRPEWVPAAPVAPSPTAPAPEAPPDAEPAEPQDYWQAFRDHLLRHGSSLRPIAGPRDPERLHVSFGRAGFKLAAVASAASRELRAELLITQKDAAPYFALLKRDKDTIERHVGEPLTWHGPDRQGHCRIYLSRPAAPGEAADWDTQHAWLRERLETLLRVFNPRVKVLDIGDPDNRVELGE
jgi:hypothetical protein